MRSQLPGPSLPGPGIETYQLDIAQVFAAYAAGDDVDGPIAGLPFWSWLIAMNRLWRRSRLMELFAAFMAKVDQVEAPAFDLAPAADLRDPIAVEMVTSLTAAAVAPPVEPPFCSSEASSV